MFTAAQAVSNGATRSAVRYRLDIGEWIPVAGRGLVRRGTVIGHKQRASAACLSWPSGVVCLRSAAEFYKLPLRPDPDPDARTLTHLWVPMKLPKLPGLVAHRVAGGAVPAASAVAHHGNIRLTSKVETILDCLSLLDLETSKALSSWVLTRNLLPFNDLERALVERKGRRGRPQLRQMSELLLSRAASSEERRLHRLLTAAGISGWKANATVRDRTGKMFNVDILFTRQALVIELDGASYHTGDRHLADLDRHRRLQDSGYRILRLMPADLSNDFEALNRIQSFLGQI